MFNFNLFENINLTCAPSLFTRKSKHKHSEDGLDRNIYNVSKEYKISILPIIPDFDIDNLYPITDQVHKWSILIVGNDKTYILASIKDPHITIPESVDLPNHTGNNILPDELTCFFDSVWTTTLTGKQLQFYMVWNGKLYFVNTYPFFNGKKKVIGAILFMRAFETMPPSRFSTLEGYIVPQKRSNDGPSKSNDGTRVSNSPRTTAAKALRALVGYGEMSPSNREERNPEIQSVHSVKEVRFVSEVLSKRPPVLDTRQNGTF